MNTHKTRTTREIIRRDSNGSTYHSKARVKSHLKGERNRTRATLRFYCSIYC